MNIKLIGSNCSNGLKQKKIIERLISNSEYNIDLDIVDDDKTIKRLNIINKPGLIINNVLVSQGKVQTDRDILKYLKLIESNV